MAHTFLSSTPEDLARSLDDANRNMQEREAQQRAVTLGLQYVNLQSFPLDLSVLAYFTEDEAKAAEGVPFFRDGRDLRIGTINPDNQLLQQKLEEFSEKYNIILYVISKASYESTLRFYSKVLVPKSTMDDVVRVDDKTDFSAALDKLKTPEVQMQATATELLADMFGSAIFLGASDIHMEPEEHLLKVRFRIDGVLQDMIHFDAALQKKLISRIKILSKLKLNVTNVPQDGRLSFFYGGKAVDVRISLLPSGYGESVVMRLLGIGATNLKLAELGLRGRAYEVIEAELNKPNGMIITTGPTGSGKTTTLYAFLNELNEPGVKIITLEDPIEYKLPGIQQTPIDYHVDFSFVKGLRAILRQDPDIIMVGEIRDGETADTALQAALTGHIVLSTLHTNDASGAVPRLVTMGVKPFVIAPAVNAIIAQRLVRKLCPVCRVPAKLPATTLDHVKQALRAVPVAAKLTIPDKLEFFNSPGCPACHNLGYQGRIGIYEVMQVNDPMKELILKDSSSRALRDQAFKDGTTTMLQDGLIKALEGITDVEEVFRVAGD
jgi:type IV pilus assembly protein PilB